MTRFAAAKAVLLQNLEPVARELAPGGSVQGGVYVPRNPTRADKSPGSFLIWLRGQAAGAWTDHATGEKGDAIDLVAYLLGMPWGPGSDRRPAVEWIEDRFGVRAMDPVKRRELAERAKATKARVESEQASKDARKRSGAAKMYHDARKELRGTEAEIYLATRGITLRDLVDRPRGALEPSMRFAPRLEWWLGRDRETGELGPEFPAIVTKMSAPCGKLQAVHCTFLNLAGDGKAPVVKPKLMWPSTRGAVMRVGLGASNMTPEEAAAAGKRGLCVLTEGLEDALTFVAADERLRVWAAGSLPGLLEVPDHECVSGWLVARDRDWGKPQAAALFEAALARLRETGKPVTELEPTSGKDFNDMARA